MCFTHNDIILWFIYFLIGEKCSLNYWVNILAKYLHKTLASYKIHLLFTTPKLATDDSWWRMLLLSLVLMLPLLSFPWFKVFLVESITSSSKLIKSFIWSKYLLDFDISPLLQASKSSKDTDSKCGRLGKTKSTLNTRTRRERLNLQSFIATAKTDEQLQLATALFMPE